MTNQSHINGDFRETCIFSHTFVYVGPILLVVSSFDDAYFFSDGLGASRGLYVKFIIFALFL